jgi:hypothetical protein
MRNIMGPYADAGGVAIVTSNMNNLSASCEIMQNISVAFPVGHNYMAISIIMD